MKKSLKVGSALIIAFAAVLALSTPAQAASNAAACSATTEVCRVTILSATNSPVTVATGFGGVSGTAYYSVNKAIYGDNICTGYIGFLTSKTCSLGTYRGQVTFTFYKGQNTVGTIAIHD
jgi:hypothetical protein